jgi:hypothetical protein
VYGLVLAVYEHCPPHSLTVSVESLINGVPCSVEITVCIVSWGAQPNDDQALVTNIVRGGVCVNLADPRSGACEGHSLPFREINAMCPPCRPPWDNRWISPHAQPRIHCA